MGNSLCKECSRGEEERSSYLLCAHHLKTQLEFLKDLFYFVICMYGYVHLCEVVLKGQKRESDALSRAEITDEPTIQSRCWEPSWGLLEEQLAI